MNLVKPLAPATYYLSYFDLNDKTGYYKSQIKNIFFETSSRTNFESETQKQKFFQIWTDFYFTHETKNIFLAIDEEDKVLGYLTGCFDTAGSLEKLVNTSKSYNLFFDLYPQFPAHLHVNVSEIAQGKGIGSELVEIFIENCTTLGLAGVHIITSPTASNIAFYKKRNFKLEEKRKDDKGNEYLFMGRSL